VDRETPFGDGHEYPPPELLSKEDRDQGLKWEDIARRRGPTANDLEPASVGTQAAPVHLHHLRLWRDTYYTLDPGRADASPRDEDWSDPTRWDSLRRIEYMTMYVQPGHYLCLGDNSPSSADSRQWGLVPDRLMLGRALLVYFPMDRIGPIR
jgi:signal peptidase I